MYERPWVEKFKTGEYLSKWKGYDTILIGGPYSQNIGIGEEKFIHCIDYEKQSTIGGGRIYR